MNVLLPRGDERQSFVAGDGLKPFRVLEMSFCCRGRFITVPGFCRDGAPLSAEVSTQADALSN